MEIISERTGVCATGSRISEENMKEAALHAMNEYRRRAKNTSRFEQHALHDTQRRKLDIKLKPRMKTSTIQLVVEGGDGGRTASESLAPQDFLLQKCRLLMRAATSLGLAATFPRPPADAILLRILSHTVFEHS